MTMSKSFAWPDRLRVRAITTLGAATSSSSTYASYAVTERANFAGEHPWQLGELERLAGILG